MGVSGDGLEDYENLHVLILGREASVDQPCAKVVIVVCVRMDSSAYRPEALIRENLKATVPHPPSFPNTSGTA